MKTYADLRKYIIENKLYDNDLKVAYRYSTLSPIKYLNLFYHGNSLHFSETKTDDIQKPLEKGQDFIQQLIDHEDKNRKRVLDVLVTDVNNALNLTLINGNTYSMGFKIYDFQIENDILILDVY